MAHKKRLIHDFPACKRTYATLIIKHVSANTNEVTQILQLKPDQVNVVGDIHWEEKLFPISTWLLGTREKGKFSESRDLRAHVEWLLKKLESKEKEIKKLCKLGYEIEISCFWERMGPDGGPFFDKDFIKMLSKYPIGLELDIC